MKKWLALVLCACLLLSSGCALADKEQATDLAPRDVLAPYKQDNLSEVYQDCILFADMPRGEYCLLLSSWWLYGYILEDGAWRLSSQVSPMEQEANSRIYFRRHATGAAPGLQGTCGLTYPDDTGFDLVKIKTRDPDSVVMLMQFHWEGDYFRLVGWQAGSAGQFAIWEDGLWAYFDGTTGERLGSARLDRLFEYGLIADEASLPQTLADARKMETVARAAAETLFPGWTMESYQEYNMGYMAQAGYYRVADGLLTIRRILLRSDAGGVSYQSDTIPIPLSEALLLRLQTEDAGALLDTSGEINTFLTDAAFDRTKIPVADTVLQSDLQTQGLILLTEDGDGVRRLRWVEMDGEGYSVRSSQPLPENSSMDLFHCGDGELCLEWDAQYNQCSFSRSADGNWALDWVIKYGPNSSIYGTLYCGILQSGIRHGTDGIFVGSHPWHDLFLIDFAQLPESIEEAIAALDREGWAVVSNPDPTDRLHLRARPDTASESLGKFYNHTPVRVLEQRDGWARVRVGTDGRLEGWMMTKYLAFGSAMDAVASASPELILRDGYENSQLFASADMRETTGVPFGYDTWIAGVVGDELYILLDTDGNTGFLPQSWFWSGNG